MRANLRQGSIYSAEDWRAIEITMTGMKELEARLDGNPIEGSGTTTMPYALHIEELLIEARGDEAMIHLEAEILVLKCSFQGIDYKDWPAPPDE